MLNIVMANATPNKVLPKRPKEKFLLPEDLFIKNKVIKNYVFSPEYRIIG